MAKFNVLNKSEELTNYILTILEKSPKKIRLDIVPEIRKKALIITEYIVKANHYAINGDKATDETVEQRKYFQDECMIEIKVLDSFLETANRYNYITNKQLEVATKLSADLHDMVSKWQDSDNKRKIKN